MTVTELQFLHARWEFLSTFNCHQAFALLPISGEVSHFFSQLLTTF